MEGRTFAARRRWPKATSQVPGGNEARDVGGGGGGGSVMPFAGAVHALSK